VDFFDKRTIEVIKYRLSRAVQIEESSSHNCTFTCQVKGSTLTELVNRLWKGDFFFHFACRCCPGVLVLTRSLIC